MRTGDASPARDAHGEASDHRPGTVTAVFAAAGAAIVAVLAVLAVVAGNDEGPRLPPELDEAMATPQLRHLPTSGLLRRATEAIVVGDVGARELADDLGHAHAVTDVDVVDRQAADVPDGNDLANNAEMLRVTTSDRESALLLAGLAARADVAEVHTPSCGALAAAAVSQGAAHARRLLDEAACQQPVVLDAGHEEAPPWVATAGGGTGHDDRPQSNNATDASTDQVCLSLLRAKRRQTHCSSPLPEATMRLGPAVPAAGDVLVVGVTGNDAEMVEITVDGRTRTVETVTIDAGVSGFAAKLPDFGVVQMQAMDAAGEPVAEGQQRISDEHEVVEPSPTPEDR